MKRLCLLLSLLLLAGCAAPAPSESAPAATAPAESQPSTIAFTDDLGRAVELAPPQRVAALIGSFADVWCAAGGRESLVAAAHDAWTSFDLDLGGEVTDLGATTEPNLEALLATQPDFILASCNTAADLELQDTLERAGLTVAYFDVEHFTDYLEMLEICTQLTGCGENYDRNGVQVKAQVDAAIARQDGSAPRVLYVRASGSSCKAKSSSGNVLGEMLSDLGCINIADSDASLLEDLSLEAIMAADPDYIFAVLQGADPTRAQAMLDATLLSNPAWESLTAVREGRFFTLEHRLFNLKPNERWGTSYEILADILYPQ